MAAEVEASALRNPNGISADDLIAVAARGALRASVNRVPCRLAQIVLLCAMLFVLLGLASVVLSIGAIVLGYGRVSIDLVVVTLVSVSISCGVIVTIAVGFAKSSILRRCSRLDV
jgi:hypothetical protein